MLKIYYSLCIKGRKNFNDVPEHLQEDLKEMLEENGYIINKDGTVEKEG